MTDLEEVSRTTWPVVVASTARFTRDLDLAEDCAQEAVERALRVWPSPVVALNRAVARGRLPGADPAAVLAEIDALAPELGNYPYLPAARADLLARLGRSGEAATAYDDALARTGNPVERRFLARRRAELGVRAVSPRP